jgi:hypothetical protein
MRNLLRTDTPTLDALVDVSETDWDMRGLLSRAGLRCNENAITIGAQTERRGGAGGR